MIKEQQKLIKQLQSVRALVKEQKPLIHCITNPISIHECANVILAVGARPIMAEHPKEVEEITATSSAVMLNLGNITDARIESMRLALQTANENGIPVLIDLVGVTCSRLRNAFARKLIEKGRFAVIKGNISEILAMAGLPYHGSGIDAGEKDALTTANEKQVCDAICRFAREHGSAVLATGKTDLITDGNHTYFLDNGDARLSQITGTGCMVGALTTAFLTECKEESDSLVTFTDKDVDVCKEMPDIKASVGMSSLVAPILGAGIMGIAGEQAAACAKGAGSFQVKLLDTISEMTDEQIRSSIRIREEII